MAGLFPWTSLFQGTLAARAGRPQKSVSFRHMRRSWLPSLLLLLLLMYACGSPAHEQDSSPADAKVTDAGALAPQSLPPQVMPPEGIPPTVDRLAPFIQERVRAATVLVVTGRGTGSGFVVARTGRHLLIVTNQHVLGAAYGVGRHPWPQVVFNSGTPDPEVQYAEVLAVDARRDLALLRTSRDQPVEPLAFAEPPALPATPAGTRLFVMGFPFGFSGAVLGQLPAPNLSSGPLLRRTDNPRLDREEILVGAIGNPGNSGGPCVDPLGRVVGVLTLKRINEPFSILVSAGTTRAFVETHLPQDMWLPAPATQELPLLGTVRLEPQADARIRQAVARLFRYGRPAELAVVVAQDSERLFLVTSESTPFDASTPQLEFLEGSSGRVSELKWLRSNDAGTLFSIPLQPTPRSPVGIKPGTDFTTGDAVWLARMATAGAPDAGPDFLLQGATVARLLLNPSGKVRAFEIDLPLREDVSGPVFDQEGALSGFVWSSLKNDQQTSIRPGTELLDLLEARVKRVELSLARDCTLQAVFHLEDLLGTAREVGVRAAPVGELPLFPAGVEGIEPQPLTVLRQSPQGPSPLKLEGPLPECAPGPRFVQAYLLTDRFHTLSLPWALRAGNVRMLEHHRGTWRQSGLPAPTHDEEDLGAPPPEAMAAARYAPSHRLDPQRLYRLVSSRGPHCVASIQDVEAPGWERCLSVSPGVPLFVRGDGRLVYASNFEDGMTYRATRILATATPHRSHDRVREVDEILAREPCATAAGNNSSVASLFDGGLAFHCGPGEYWTESGQRIETGGADVLRFGARGRMLMRTPWGGLAIKTPGAPARVVTGLPEDLCDRCLMATRATPEGFWVAIQDLRTGQLRTYFVPMGGKAQLRAKHPLPSPMPSGFFLTARGIPWALDRQDAWPLTQVRRLKPRQSLSQGEFVNGSTSMDETGWSVARPLLEPGLERQDPQCHRPLRLDPRRVYALTDASMLVDANELVTTPKRFSYVQGVRFTHRPVISPDRQLLYTDPFKERPMRFEPDGAWWNPERRTCVSDASLDHPDSTVEEDVCKGGRMVGFKVHPDSGVPVYECVGGTPLRGYLMREGAEVESEGRTLLHAGYGGTLLFDTSNLEEWLLRGPGGRRAIARTPDLRHSHDNRIRASPEGFLVARTSRNRSDDMELTAWRIHHDGRSKRLPAYPTLTRRDAPRTGDGVLQRDGTYVLLGSDDPQRHRLLIRLKPGARRPDIRTGPMVDVGSLITGG